MAMHKCENCEVEVRWNGRKQRGERCAGWVGSLKSKWGKKYDKQRGLAWWCPKPDCQEQHNLATIEKIFPSMPVSAMQVLMADIELQRLREN